MALMVHGQTAIEEPLPVAPDDDLPKFPNGSDQTEPITDWENADPDMLFKAAVKAKDNNQLDVAEALFRQILTHRWDEPQVLLLLGQTLTQNRRWEEARGVALQLLAAKPFDPDGLMLAAYVLSALGDAERAGLYHTRALEIAPLAPVERWNWSLHCLRHGDWHTGWDEYEWGAAIGKRHRRSPYPAWNGEKCGGSLYIYPEQGYGDVLMGLRFVPIARRVGGFSRVVVEVPESMATLVLSNAGRLGIDAVYATQNNGAFGEVTDQQISVMSLPRALKLHSREQLGEWVAVDPVYLSAERAFPHDGRWRVGVAWQGSAGHQNDAIRSVKWETVLPFVKSLLANGYEVFSLIPGVPEEMRHPDVIYFESQGTNWKDTAELIASLHSVVTVDTAVGHLAGAMGTPCRLLLAYDPDFRWGVTGTATEWYPCHTLWRQAKGEEWAAVLARLSEEFGETPSAGIYEEERRQGAVFNTSYPDEEGVNHDYAS